MKKLLFIIFISILFISHVFTQSKPKVLRIEEPEESLKKQNILQMNLENLKEIISDYKLEGISATIEFSDSSGQVFAKLAKVKKGKLKWAHKLANNEILNVKFKKPDYAIVLDKIKQKNIESGFQIQIIDKKTKDMLRSYRITFLELPDLTVTIKYPFRVFSGEEIGKDVSVTLENKGTVVAKNFIVDIVLSGDNKIPIKSAVYSEKFGEDALLKDGKMKVEAIKPGERLTLDIKGSIKIPADTPPKKYYVAAVVDSENKVEEINEENNINIGMIMISVAAPKSIILSLTNTSLVFKPAIRDLKVYWGNSLISDGKEWRIFEIRPYLFQIKHVFWKDFHWEIDTFDRSVWRIRGAKFGRTGGSGKDLGIRVETKGGTKNISPQRVTLRLNKTKITFEPMAGKFLVLFYNDIISYAALWRTCRLKSFQYQFMCSLWKNFYIEIDSFNKQVKKITGGKFCKPGGTPKLLNLNLKVEQ